MYCEKAREGGGGKLYNSILFQQTKNILRWLPAATTLWGKTAVTQQRDDA